MKTRIMVGAVLLAVKLALAVQAASGAPAFYSPLDQWHVTSGFGPRPHPVTGRPDFHAAVDLRAAQGTPVRPVAAGRVHAAYTDPEAGLVIVLTHDDGYESHYYHLSRIDVRWGQRVDRGMILGATGATGLGSGPHLHLAIKRQGVALDPQRNVQPLPRPSWGDLPPDRIGRKSGFGLVHPPYGNAGQAYRDGDKYWLWINNRWEGYMVQQGKTFLRYSRLDPANATATYKVTKWLRQEDGKMQWQGNCFPRVGSQGFWYCVWR